MGGAAAVLGAARAVAALRPQGVQVLGLDTPGRLSTILMAMPAWQYLGHIAMACQVHFIIAACENMIDGHGLLPSDVLTASNGKTVEASRRLPLASSCDRRSQAVNVDTMYLSCTAEQQQLVTCS